MIPYGQQDITQTDIDAVIEVMRSDFLTQGPVVPRFEQAVADYCTAKFGVAVNSATSALHIACLALDLGPGDLLWTTPNTFVASANCALYCGANVDFVDIDPRTYNMSVERLQEKLEQASKTGRLPKIVVPVHFAGQPCDMPAIHALSQKYGFKIIEDASHASGASYVIARSSEAATWQSSEATRQSSAVIASGEAAWQSKPIKVGACIHSDITVFSFHPVKIITTGEGGMALTDNPILAEKMTLLRSHGIIRDPAKMTHESDGPWYYQQIDLGYNYRMTDIQAALGISQMSRIDTYISRRRRIAGSYDELLRDLPLVCPWQASDSQSAWHLYVVRLQLGKLRKTHRQIFEFMRAQGSGVNLHYIPVYRQPHYRRMGFNPLSYPEMERYYAEAFSLPIYPSLTQVQQDAVVCALTNAVECSRKIQKL